VNTPVLTTMLRALLRWWWLIVLSVSLGVGVGYVLRNEQADLYYTEATVLIGQSANSAAPIGVNREVLDAYTVLLTRNNLLQPVINDLGLNISVNEMLDYMTVTTNSRAALITIGITDTDPERAAAIANRIVDELIRQTSDRATVLDMNFVNSQVENIQNQISDLQAQYNDLVEKAAGLTSAFDLNQNLQSRSQIETTIRELRTVLLSLLENTPRSEVQVFEAAEPNYFPITANSTRDMVIAGFAGGVLAVLTIVLFTFFDDRLQWDEGRQETILGLKVLGPLGIIPRSKLPLYVETYPHSVEAEALRQLRAKIALSTGGNFPRVLTVMSYDSGEGKTLTTSNLALESARSGLRTLAIDGDMRQGDLHEVFQLPNVFGLSDILQSSEPVIDLLPKALLKSGYDGLTIMPAGRSAADPAALLGKPRFVDLIDLLASRYDAIVMDAAPTIGGPDAVFLADASDGVIIVVNARRTRLSSLKLSLEDLQSGSNIHILGLVFNRVRLQVTSKYNNTYYRQTPTLTPEKLSREMARPGAGFFAAGRHIIIDRSGERLFSVDACAARLGIKRRTVRSWIDTGYIRAERRYLRPWIRESSINTILEQRMTAAPPEPDATRANQSANVNGTHHVPDQLREQREAILGFLNQPNRPDPEN
jgi:capsular exopolysaccharide synthesis family protein